MRTHPALLPHALQRKESVAPDRALGPAPTSLTPTSLTPTSLIPTSLTPTSLTPTVVSPQPSPPFTNFTVKPKQFRQRSAGKNMPS
ncbi:hypothetical protein ACOMHN_028819 [Nucella lapillus]